MKKPTCLILIALLFIVQCSKSETDPIEQEIDDHVTQNPSDDDPIELPTIETLDITEISKGSALSGGLITEDGGADITAIGICWSREPEPTIDNDSTSEDLDGESFNSELDGLSQGTMYYVRAYATNRAGTAYGNELSFTTTELPDKIYTGDLLFSTQAEIDAFVVHEYTEIDGTVIIQGVNPTEILNLTGLQSTRTVTGNLEIIFNEEINDLKGLESIRTIGNELKIWGNTKLIDFEELSSLTEAQGLSIQVNPSLNDMSALSGLCSLGSGTIHIFLNNSLQTLDGLQNIKSVGAGLLITNNGSLLNLDGLSDLETAGMHVEIARNNSLENIDGLNSLQSIGSFMRIYENESLNSIDGFNSLVEVGEIDIYDNPSLSRINGFNTANSLTIQSDLVFERNPALAQINGFSNLTTVSGKLEINNNNGLTNLIGFDRLETIGQNLIIDWNHGLETIDAFENLSSIGDALRIESNFELLSISGFANLSQLRLLAVTHNDLLTDLCGLTNIINNGISGTYNVSNNAYDPTQGDIQSGNCSQ